MRASSLLTFISLAVAASAAPSYGSGNSISGAVYWFTNDPSGNKIVSTAIGPNGLLGPSVKGFSTGGRGLPGITEPPNGPDQLFSQGAVWVNSKAKLLATVNPGSNTVALFSIDPQDPTELKLIGKPVPSGGEFPQSVTINSKATEACVLNGGKVNGVNCFTIHPVTGLTPKSNTLRFLNRNQTTPPTGPFDSLSQVIFSPDDSVLIGSVKGDLTSPGYLTTWTVLSDGSLSSQFVKTVPSPGGALPFSLTPIPGHNAYLATDPAVGVEVFNFGGTSAKNGKLEATFTLTPVPGQKALCWSTYGQKSGSYYTTDTGTNIVTEVHVDKNLNASIVKQYQLPGAAGILDEEVATIGHNDFLYVLSSVDASIVVLSANTPGNASILQSFGFSSAAKKAGITIANNLTLAGLATYVKN